MRDLVPPPGPERPFAIDRVRSVRLDWRVLRTLVIVAAVALAMAARFVFG